jgi:hypothetical protein
MGRRARLQGGIAAVVDVFSNAVPVADGLHVGILLLQVGGLYASGPRATAATTSPPAIHSSDCLAKRQRSRLRGRSQAPASKVTTKLSVVNVSTWARAKRREKGSCPPFRWLGHFFDQWNNPALVVFKNLVGASASLQLGRADQPCASFLSRAGLS